MKRIIGLSFLSILVFSTNVSAQKKIVNRAIVSENGAKMLTGEFNRLALEDDSFKDWYYGEYQAYETEKSKLKDLKNLRNYRLEVFVGTWCSDSQRELPRLYKILDEIKFPQNRLKVIAVNREKKSFYGEEMGKKITHVPTIIVYDKKHKEIGRIVETPVSGSLEEDLAQIVKGSPLKPNYTND